MPRDSNDACKTLVRLLSVVCLCVLIGACSTANSNPSQAAQTPQAQVPATKYIGAFSSVPGTIYLRAPIIKARGGSSGFSFSSPGYASEFAHNYVYLNTETGQTLQLLPDNNAVILQSFDFPEKPNDVTTEWTIQWILYVVAKNDTNNDSELNSDDAKTLAISDGGGQGYTELIDGVVELHGQTLRDPETLLVIYRKDGKLFLSRINLMQRVIDETLALPTFGSDVKL